MKNMRTNGVARVKREDAGLFKVGRGCSMG